MVAPSVRVAFLASLAVGVGCTGGATGSTVGSTTSSSHSGTRSASSSGGAASSGSSANGGSSGGSSGSSTGVASGSSSSGGTSINLAALPLGDGKVSLTTPQVGYIFSCGMAGGGGGASAAGPWIDFDAGTFDFTAKVVVQGNVSWPNASYSVDVDGGVTLVTSNDLPNQPTGTFPIASTDPAYQYDQNPNHLGVQALSYGLPSNPTVAATPTCLGGGPIGILFTGAVLYDGLDAEGRDALAHEVQDLCQGHPDISDMYHYHILTMCLADPGTGHSNLLGYALDGFGIYGNRGVNGESLTDADLDECHGHTHEILWNGQMVSMYHYHATYEYPYSLGCFRGTPLQTGHGGSSGGSGGADGGAGGGACDGGCSASDVCCPTGQPCAGTCVPNCNLTGTCPSGLTCDASLGICTP